MQVKMLNSNQSHVLEFLLHVENKQQLMRNNVGTQ